MYLTDKELQLGASQQDAEWGEGYYDPNNSTSLRTDGAGTRANGNRLLRSNPIRSTRTEATPCG